MNKILKQQVYDEFCSIYESENFNSFSPIFDSFKKDNQNCLKAVHDIEALIRKNKSLRIPNIKLFLANSEENAYDKMVKLLSLWEMVSEDFN